MAAAVEPTPNGPMDPNIGPRTWRSADSLLLLALAALCFLLIALQVQWTMTPIEDALMLLRYSQHFGQGFGIRWNIDQPPVDGATDFLFMVAIGALAHVAHIGVITASRILNLGAHLGSVLLIFLGGRRLLGANRWVCAAAAAYLAAGPAVVMSNACFGPPFFAFLLLACWYAGLAYALFRPTWTIAILMSLLGLLAGLTRPEGVLIAIMLLAATLYLTLQAAPDAAGQLGWRRCLPLFVSFTLVFALLGGAYFVWRWKYFGYPLPNPFYIKGNGHLFPRSVLSASTNIIRTLAPALPLLPLGWLSPRTRPLAQVLTALTIGFALMWVLLANANNHFGRFQYPIVPLFLMTVTALASGLLPLVSTAIQSRPAIRPWIFPAAGGLALAISMFYADHLVGNSDVEWGMQAFATRLQPLAGKGYTLAVTEAGALPFYSQWRAIDGFGLNDSYIAHHNQQISAEYLDRFHPEVIMVHIDAGDPSEFLPGGLRQPPVPGGGYNPSLMNFYAGTHGYTLAAAWGPDPCNLHLYWVRPGFADYDTVLGDIRDHPYYFLDDGYFSHDYRNELDSIQGCALPAGPA